VPTPLRFTRWTNPSLPQTLQYAVILLYVEAVFGVLSLLGTGFGDSAYYFRGSRTLVSVAMLAASAVYGLAGAAIANEQRRGWLVGTVVAVGALVLPVLTYGLSILASGYIITYLFNVALVALLVHPMSRSYQKVWFK